MVGSNFCPECGAATTREAEVGASCGRPIAQAPTEKSWMPMTAGILSIIAGVSGVAAGTLVATLGSIIGRFFGILWPGILGVPSIIFGIIAVAGGICALRRRVWGLALAGSICALVSGFFVVMKVLGILAIIFVSLGKGEFK